MAIVACHCGSRFRVGDEWIGKQARCPACSTVVPVPAAEPTAETQLSDSTAPEVQAPAAPPSGMQFAPPARPAAVEPVTSSTDDEFAPPPVAESAASAAVHPEAAVLMQQVREPHSAVPQTNELPAPAADQGTPGLEPWLRPLLLITGSLAVLILGGLGFYAWLTSSPPEPLPKDHRVVASADSSATSNSRQDESEGGIDAREARDDVPQAGVAENSGDERPPPVPAPTETRKPEAEAPRVTPSRPPEVDPARSSVPPSQAGEVGSIGEPSNSNSAGGLSGISNQYDDPHCQKLQRRFAWRVPAAAEFVEVDGERLPIVGFEELRKVRAPYLFLPRGDHAIRLRAGEQPIRVAIDDHLAATSSAMRSFFGVGGEVRRQDLLARAARAMDVHGAPFLLNIMGAASITDGEWAAAERKFRRSLVVNPFFAPAHLNLAVCLIKRGDTEGGVRELRLADALNVGNVFGLSAAITNLRRQHVPPDASLEAMPLDVAHYVSSEQLTVEDERLTALMTAMAKYAVREEDRGKILNNLAVHFSETGKAETALEHFRSALAALKLAGPERFSLAEKVLSHMESACRRSNFPEAEEYAFMRKSVLP